MLCINGGSRLLIRDGWSRLIKRERKKFGYWYFVATIKTIRSSYRTSHITVKRRFICRLEKVYFGKERLYIIKGASCWLWTMLTFVLNTQRHTSVPKAQPNTMRRNSSITTCWQSVPARPRWVFKKKRDKVIQVQWPYIPSSTSEKSLKLFDGEGGIRSCKILLKYIHQLWKLTLCLFLMHEQQWFILSSTLPVSTPGGEQVVNMRWST